jgi:hypothetical protein
MSDQSSKVTTDESQEAADRLRHDERRAAVHRQLDALREAAPYGCTRDRVELLFNWLNAALEHLMDDAPLADGQSLDQWSEALDAFDSMRGELAARGFIVPEFPTRDDDPLGLMIACRDYLDAIRTHVWAADQMAVDSLLASITEKQ